MCMRHECVRCLKVITPVGRVAAGYNTCMACGDAMASKTTRCVVPMHKGNYVLVTNRADLININNKGPKQ